VLTDIRSATRGMDKAEVVKVRILGTLFLTAEYPRPALSTSRRYSAAARGGKHWALPTSSF
jgi:hypothetical protein